MGKFIWHDWARFVSISASICEWPSPLLLALPGARLMRLVFGRLDLGVDLGYPVPQVLLGLYRSWLHQHDASDSYVRALPSIVGSR